jgi:hypothetical protein
MPGSFGAAALWLRGEGMDVSVERRIRLAIKELARASGVPIRDLEINQVDIAIRRDLSPDELNQVSVNELFGVWKRLADEQE